MNRWRKFSRYPWLWPYLFLVAIAVVVLYPLLFGRFYAVGDMRDVTIPLEVFFHQETLAGRLPAWHPDVSWGFPVIASAQIGFFYPWLLMLRALPIWLYLPLTLVVHVSALLLGTYLFLRQRVSVYPALLGSLSFGLSSFVWQHVSHLNIFLSIAWLPWQLLAAQQLTAQPKKYRAFALVALSLGIPFLIGQLQLPLLQAVFVSAYLFFQLPGRVSIKIPKIGLIAVLVALISAAQVIPTIELLRFSTRGSGGDFDVVRANQHSFPLYHLPTLIFPRFFGNDSSYWGKRLEIEYGVFIGSLPLLLSLSATWTYLRQRHRNPALAFWILAATITGLLALGSLSPFRWFGLEPSLWFFSAPARWLLFTCFAGSVLAAYGLEHAKRQPRTAARIIGLGLGVVCGVVIIGNIALFFAPQLLGGAFLLASTIVPTLLAGQDATYYQQKLASLLTSLQQTGISLQSPFTYLPLFAVASGLYALKRQWWLVLIITVAVEVGVVAASTAPTLPWRQILSPPETVALLPELVQQKQARVIALQPDGDTGAFFTNPQSRVDQAGRDIQRQLLLPMQSAQHGLAGIQWPASLDIVQQAHVLESLTLASPTTFNSVAAAARTVGAVLIPRSLGTLNVPSIDGTDDIAIYQLPAAPRVEVIGHTAHVPVIYQELTPRHLRLTVTSPCTCTLIIRDSWYPGWRATIDGRAVPILPAENIFRSIELLPGAQVIDVTYIPTKIYVGIAVSLLGIGGCIFLLGLARGRVDI